MPNKFSHALVLSHYESRGLIDPDRPHASQCGTSKSVKPTDRSLRPSSQITRLHSTTSQWKPPSRIRIDSPDGTSSHPLPPPLLRHSSSAETQIYAPRSLSSPPSTPDVQTLSNTETRQLNPRQRPPSTREVGEEKSRPSIETQIYDPKPSHSAVPQTDWNSESQIRRPASQASSFNGSRLGSSDNKTRVYNTQRPLSPTSHTNWQSSSEVKARRRAAQGSSIKGSRSGYRDRWPEESGRNTPQSPALTVAPHQNAPNKVQPFPSRPPSPPATPDSGKSFGLETHLDRIDKMEATAAVTSDIRKCFDLKPHLDRPENGRSQAAATPDSGHSSGRDTQVGRPAGREPPPPVPDRSQRRTPPKSSPSSQRSRSPALQPKQDNMKSQTAKPVHSHISTMSKHSPVRNSARSSTLRFESEPTRPKTSESSQTTFSITTQSSSRLSATALTSPPPPESTACINPRAPKSLHFPNFSVSTQSSYGYSPTSPKLQFHHEPPRTKTSHGHRSPTFSLPTRTSSLSATNFSPVLSRTSSMPSRALVDDDADLESLPSTILDLDIIPWEHADSGRAIHRHVAPADERPTSSRSSSFESAVPPPIRRLPKSPAPYDKPLPRTPKSSGAPSTPKKSTRSLSSILFSRPQAPTKTIPYSQTLPGNKPTTIITSKTSPPSIPSLFPTYRGPFPPPQKSEEHIGKETNQTITEERARLRRGVSQGAAAAEKRRSWFRNEQIDRAFGLRESLKQKAMEDIFKANLYV